MSSQASLRRTKTFLGKTSTAAARAMALNSRKPAGTASTVTAPSTEAFLRMITAGMCPWCGLGPFQVIAAHASRSHGVGGKEIRELAGLPYRASITDPEFHERKSAISRDLYGRATHGLARATPELRSKWSSRHRNRSPFAIQQFESRQSEHARAMAERRAHICAEFRDGVTVAGLAERYNVAYGSMKQMLNEEGEITPNRKPTRPTQT